MLKLPRKQDVWAMEFFLKLALTPNQIKFRNITNFPQTTVPQKVCPAAHSPMRWNEKLQARGFFREPGESQLTPRGVNACSCGPGNTEDVTIFLLVVVDFQAASPQEHQLHGNVPWS